MKKKFNARLRDEKVSPTFDVALLILAVVEQIKGLVILGLVRVLLALLTFLEEILHYFIHYDTYTLRRRCHFYKDILLQK